MQVLGIDPLLTATVPQRTVFKHLNSKPSNQSTP